MAVACLAGCGAREPELAEPQLTAERIDRAAYEELLLRGAAEGMRAAEAPPAEAASYWQLTYAGVVEAVDDEGNHFANIPLHCSAALASTDETVHQAIPDSVSVFIEPAAWGSYAYDYHINDCAVHLLTADGSVESDDIIVRMAVGGERTSQKNGASEWIPYAEILFRTDGLP